MPTLTHPRALLVAALALGICGDQLFYGRLPGVSVPIFTGMLLLTLAWISRAEGRPSSPVNRWIGAAALFFAVWSAARATPLLITMNCIAVLGLLALHVTLYRADSLFRLTGWRIVSGALLALIEAIFQPVPLAWRQASGMGGLGERGRALLVIARGALIAAPVLIVFTGLLAMADSIFASYVSDLLSLNLPFDLNTVVSHTIFTAIIVWMAAGGLIVALREHEPGSLLGASPSELPAEGETQPLRPIMRLRVLGHGEAMTVLVLVDLLFAAFMLIQGAYLFGGLDTLERTGMTFAEYARRGFFELVTVAFLALGLLWMMSLISRRDQARQPMRFNLACGAMVALVLGMLASAALRMSLYEQAYGFTTLRLLTLTFMVWLAAVLLLFLGALLRDRPRLFSLGAPIAAAIYLAALNLMNPDALIVRENIARYQATGDLDFYYLSTLSPDAIPPLVEAAPAIGAFSGDLERYLGEARSQLAEIEGEHGWPAWNLGRARAAAAIDEARPGFTSP